MMKYWIVAALFILAVAARMWAGSGSAQLFSVYKSPQDIADEFRNVYLTMQSRGHVVHQSTPSSAMVGVGYVVVVDTGTVRLFTRVRGDLYSVELLKY